MNINRIKREIRKSPNWRSIAEKFLNNLSGSRVCLFDLQWWWDEDRHFLTNLKNAERFLDILIEERALIRCSTQGVVYKKTEEFTNLLENMLRLDDILQSNKT
jgi:hypothetical protein